MEDLEDIPYQTDEDDVTFPPRTNRQTIVKHIRDFMGRAGDRDKAREEVTRFQAGLDFLAADNEFILQYIQLCEENREPVLRPFLIYQEVENRLPMRKPSKGPPAATTDDDDSESDDDDDDDDDDESDSDDSDEDYDPDDLKEWQSGTDDDEEIGDVLFPHAWHLLFRHRLPPNARFVGWPGDIGQRELNSDDIDADLFMDMRDLERFADPNDSGFYTFRISFPRDGGPSGEPVDPTIWKQTSGPYEDSVADFDPYESPVEDYLALDNDLGLRPCPSTSEVPAVFAFGDIYIGQADVFYMNKMKGMTANGKDLSTSHMELAVEVPAICRYPLLENFHDLDCGEDAEAGEDIGFENCCLHFKGNDDSTVSISDRDEFGALTNGFAISMWYQQSRTDTFTYLICREGPKKGISLSVRYTSGIGNVLRGQVKTSQGLSTVECVTKKPEEFEEKLSAELAQFASEDEDWKWYHAVLQYSKQESSLELWVNGRLEQRKPAPGQYRVKKDGDFYLGENCETGRDLFTGRMYDVCIFAQPLSASAIRALMECGMTRQELIKAKFDASQGGGHVKGSKSTMQMMMARMKQRNAGRATPGARKKRRQPEPADDEDFDDEDDSASDF